MFVYTMAVFSIYLQKKQVSSFLMPTEILRSQLKVTCCNLDLAPCILQKMRDIHKRTSVGHLFSELFFELSHIYLITFCSNNHVLASVFFSVSESVKLHRLFWVTSPALTLKTILILAIRSAILHVFARTWQTIKDQPWSYIYSNMHTCILTILCTYRAHDNN